MIEQEFLVDRAEGNGECIRIAIKVPAYMKYVPAEGDKFYIGTEVVEVLWYDAEKNVITCHNPYTGLRRARVIGC